MLNKLNISVDLNVSRLFYSNYCIYQKNYFWFLINKQKTQGKINLIDNHWGPILEIWM